MNGYNWYWFVKEELAKCDLLTSESDKTMCKASVLGRAQEIGFTERALLLQAVRQPTVVQASAALPILAIIGIAAFFLAKKR